MSKSVPPFNPRENGDTDQEAFWAEEPSIKTLTDNLGALMNLRPEMPDASSKIQSLPDSIKNSPFLMALGQQLLEDHPNMSAEKLLETLRGA